MGDVIPGGTNLHQHGPGGAVVFDFHEVPFGEFLVVDSEGYFSSVIGLAGVLLAGSTLRSGGVSLYQLLWPIRYTVAGMLLMSPGFVSTLIAGILLLPIKGGPTISTPQNDGRPFGTDFEHNNDGFRSQATRARIDRNDDIIEGEYTVTDSPEQEKRDS